jgi:hypothetical protein
MRLITEFNDSTQSVIVEDKDSKNLYIEGIFLQADVQNRNGRIYPKTVLEKAVGEYDRTFVKTRRAMGELNHPKGPQVNPERASHIITEIRQDGSNFIGKAKVLTTPMGQLVRSLVEDGVQIGVSSRGMGSVKESNGASVVQSDFWLATVDVVSDPSAPQAFVNGLYEGKEWIWDNGVLKEVDLNEIVNVVEESTRKVGSAKAEIDAFKAFMDKIVKI